MAAFAENAANQSVIGSPDKARYSLLAIAGKPSGLVFVDSAGTEWVFWVQSNVLTFGTRTQYLAQSGGTAV